MLEAACFAADRHRDQRRKDVDATLYINHPVEKARILTCAGVDDIDVLIAAVVHDTIEDTQTAAEDVTDLFGERVTGLVLEVTDDKCLLKAECKGQQLLNAPNKSDGAKMIKIADKIAKLRDCKSSSPSWSDERIHAYVKFAGNVIASCSGVNSKLDQIFAQRGQEVA